MFARVPVSHYLKPRHENVGELLVRCEVMHYLKEYKSGVPLSDLARTQSFLREVIVIIQYDLSSPVAVIE